MTTFWAGMWQVGTQLMIRTTAIAKRKKSAMGSSSGCVTRVRGAHTSTGAFANSRLNET